MSDHVLSAGGAAWGTDANLSPSKPDAVLRFGERPRDYAELRLPKGEGPFPLAVIWHGGCWKQGVADTAYMAALATRWQEQGIATLNVDYREVGDGGGWPGSFKDWQAASALIDRVAQDYPVDRGRVTLVGHSAGALPALWLASESGAAGPTGARTPVKARAAIVLDGPGDIGAEASAFDALCQFSAVDPFMGGTPAKAAARYAAISPRSSAPQLEEVLFVQARLPAPSQETLAAIGAAGAKVVTVANPDASHFDIITPGHPVYERNEAAMLEVLKGR
ncbi:alpha/beta hydrolase family protein [Parerythrobacter lacustris]|uniref:Alpha/beta fold hydrolase n=1 Tax=Parerythrobacter lacustris TaxID=2969984 RepID=A0ABT1XPM7_9SPHN|nr:alpha/beta fold hydrolase [Parerythrobacter lacustris]MCR2833616.1 alpha/beta fold hydrolase [Parerythrobacter lacustris]